MMHVLWHKEVVAAKGGHPGRAAADHPVDQVDVVTAFLQKVGPGILCLTAPVIVNPGTVIEVYGFVKLHADDVADNALVEQLFDLAIVRREAQRETDDKLFLNFDPRGCKIEIIDGVGVALTSGDEVLSEKKTGKPDHEDGIKIVADLTNTGVMEGAKGEAEFEIDADESEFSVKIKSVSTPGLYSVWVDGVNVGDIEVEDDGEFDGKIKYSDPQKAGTSELTFNPRGKTVAIQQGDGQVILTTDFPLE